jgi:hypothetical protein
VGRERQRPSITNSRADPSATPGFEHGTIHDDSRADPSATPGLEHGTIHDDSRADPSATPAMLGFEPVVFPDIRFIDCAIQLNMPRFICCGEGGVVVLVWSWYGLSVLVAGAGLLSLLGQALDLIRNSHVLAVLFRLDVEP